MGETTDMVPHVVLNILMSLGPEVLMLINHTGVINVLVLYLFALRGIVWLRTSSRNSRYSSEWEFSTD